MSCLTAVTKMCPTLAIPWTVALQAPLSMEFSRQEYWSGLAFPSPGDLPDPGIEPRSPALQVGSLLSEPPEKNMVIFFSAVNPPVSSCCISYLGGKKEGLSAAAAAKSL